MMAQARVKKRARPSKSGTTEATASPTSLPPLGTDQSSSASLDVPASPEPAELSPKKEWWYRDKGSKAYEQAMTILAMRAAGFDDAHIATALDLQPQSIWNLCHIANKNGWVTAELAGAKDVIEFRIMPKVMRELELGLDDVHRNQKTGLQVKTTVALEIAKGTAFKKFDPQTSGPSQSNTNVIAIKIEQVPGPPQIIREGTIHGAPAYQDAEVINDVGQQPGLVPPRGA